MNTIQNKFDLSEDRKLCLMKNSVCIHVYACRCWGVNLVKYSKSNSRGNNLCCLGPIKVMIDLIQDLMVK